MDDSDGDWIVIAQPTPKKQSTPKQVPIFCARNAVSLQQPLKKGGKAVPPFSRPASLTAPVPSVSSASRQLDPDVPLQLHTSTTIPGKRKNPEFQFISAPRGGTTRPVVAQQSTIPAELVARWMILVNSVGALSNIWQDYHQSKQFEVHCWRLLDKFAPSTLFKYINTLQCIHSILVEFAWTWHDIGRHHLSDLLQIAHEGKHTEWGFAATTAIKALRWAQKLLVISEWQMLYDPIVNSFFNSGNHERRESVPLSLFLVSQWERRILMKECSLQEQILLGGFLCLLWGGLRFADGQRISLQSLSWCITALRGSCYRTKTSRSGQPWAIQARGFLSHGAWSWVAQWLMALDILWSRAHNAISDADFLLPMTKGDSFAYPLVPMPYSQALHWLRHFCGLPWKHSPIPISANPGDYTLHSLKTTTLSWSNQLAQQGLVTEEQRHLQGHHRRGSMRLYSRDDTAGQLALQNTLIVQVQQGHRFVTPLHRGSQRPIQEPSVSLERFRKAYPDYHWLFLPFNGASSDPVLEGVPMHQESKTADTKPSQDDDSSDSSSSSTSSASSSVSHQRDMGECEEFEEFVVARIAKIQHMMLLTTDSHQPFWGKSTLSGSLWCQASQG